MREPTEAMYKAGDNVVDGQYDPWDPTKFAGLEDAWHAMIDAALAEPE